MIDIHCHLLPGLDDGAESLEVSVQMARLAVDDGVGTVVATPHQLGSYRTNSGPEIRTSVQSLQQELQRRKIPLQVLPGADVRIEQGFVAELQSGNVLTLADKGRHVLLELPHDLYFPLEPVLRQLRDAGLTGILSHPERNRGIQRRPEIVRQIVEQGCLMQLTADSITGAFGSTVRRLSESMLDEGLVHFVASDAHGTRKRNPKLTAAFTQVAARTDPLTAQDLFIEHPRCVVEGRKIPGGRRKTRRARPVGWTGWFGSKKAG